MCQQVKSIDSESAKGVDEANATEISAFEAAREAESRTLQHGEEACRGMQRERRAAGRIRPGTPGSSVSGPSSAPRKRKPVMTFEELQAMQDEPLDALVCMKCKLPTTMQESSAAGRKQEGGTRRHRSLLRRRPRK